jgi:hypothetical protein
MGGACGTYGGQERCIQDLVGKPDGKISLGGPRCRLEYTIKMNLPGVKWGSMDWTALAQDRTSGGLL